MSVKGLLDVKIINETADGECFYDFVQKYVLTPFNGHNPHSVVIMDNCYSPYTRDSNYD